jgi:ABC-type methionine transport system permease subunit
MVSKLGIFIAAGMLISFACSRRDASVLRIGVSPVPEGLPALIRAVTIMSLTLISYSAMAGAVGGGGLGDLAIRYGYPRFRPDVMVSTVVVLIIIVQTFQFAGKRLARRFDRR